MKDFFVTCYGPILIKKLKGGDKIKEEYPSHLALIWFKCSAKNMTLTSFVEPTRWLNKATNFLLRDSSSLFFQLLTIVDSSTTLEH